MLWRIGPGMPVRVADNAGRFALDPARTRAAFVDPKGALQVLTLATGAATTIAQPGRTAEVCGWLATGDIALRSTTTPMEIERVDPTSGARTHHLTRWPCVHRAIERRCRPIPFRTRCLPATAA